MVRTSLQTTDEVVHDVHIIVIIIVIIISIVKISIRSYAESSDVTITHCVMCIPINIINLYIPVSDSLLHFGERSIDLASNARHPAGQPAGRRIRFRDENISIGPFSLFLSLFFFHTINAAYNITI